MSEYEYAESGVLLTFLGAYFASSKCGSKIHKRFLSVGV